MISIYIHPNLKKRYVGDISFDNVKFTDTVDEADFSIKREIGNINSKFSKDTPKAIYLVDNLKHNQRVRIRKGYCVDNRIDIPKLKNFCFSTNDFCNIPYLITMPSGPLPAECIMKKANYWLDFNIENTGFHNKVYWCGRSSTHESRKSFMQFYNTTDDSRFNITEFTENIYQSEVDQSVYIDHIERLSKSDIGFVLRGDRPWAHTFFDVTMSGCIPVMISSMNDYGWENIFENVDDYMLRFDIREHSMEYIHKQVVTLLEDKERVLRMKANIVNFYNTFFKHSARFGFGEFLLAKCIEIYKNDFDIEKIDDKFICSEILTLKGLKGKL